MSLNADVRSSEATPREFADALTGAGGWAKVTAVNGTQVTVSFSDFDSGYQTFGPVPARDLTGGEDGIEVGDTVWLLVGSDGDSGAALKF